LPEKKVISLGHCYELKSKKIKYPFKKNVIMYVASDNKHNTYSINSFLQDGWPLVIQNMPDVKLHIYGTITDRIQVNARGVRKFGFIENLDDAYKKAKIVINPDLISSGLKIKNVEAICYGKTLVTTSPGAEGIEEGIGKAFIVEDTMKRFGYTICELLRDDIRRKRIEKNASEFAKKHFSREAVFEEFLEVLK
jgi:glycosyltransferase involved in cell wall biosynthesis